MVATTADWPRVLAAARAAAPEAFASDGRPLNLVGGEWVLPGAPRPCTSPVDGRVLGDLPALGLAAAERAIDDAARSAREWAGVDLDERRRRVTTCLDALRAHRDLLARLLVWEIGKPLKQAETDVDRCIDGVAWYVDTIEPMVAGRTPLGVVSNIASWNYPYSVLVHAVLVQALAGNAVVAKTPHRRRAPRAHGGLRPRPPRRPPGVAPQRLRARSSARRSCAARRWTASPSSAAARAAAPWRRRSTTAASGTCSRWRGVNAYGVWDYSDWPRLADQMKKGYDYGKQRCTAYARFVVERRLFPRFLDSYLETVKRVRVGNPVAVAAPDDPLPGARLRPAHQPRPRPVRCATRCATR
jgi:hypothetical protein